MEITTEFIIRRIEDKYESNYRKLIELNKIINLCTDKDEEDIERLNNYKKSLTDALLNEL